MLKNYLTIAVRNLMKHKLYSAINVLGLALGMASCILMVLFVRDEISFDKHYEKANDLYRVQLTFERPNNQSVDYASSVLPVLPLLKQQFPQIEDTTYLIPSHYPIQAEAGPQTLAVNFVPANFFSVFSFPFARGDPASALLGVNTAVISDRLARRHFPDGNAMGKTLTIAKQQKPVTITGILASDQANTHFNTDLFVSQSTIGESGTCGPKSKQWYYFCAYTYFRLAPGFDPSLIADALPALVENNAPGYERLGKVWPASEWIKLSIMPVKDIHLKSKRSEEMKPGGDISLVYVFSFLSILILVIACINFTNLATARATDRSREMGIRKVVGAERRQIILQILGESLLVATLALVIALSLVELVLPFYNDIIGKTLSLSYGDNRGLVGALLLLSVVVGFVGGIYPAFFLSSFRPVTLSKGSFSNVDRHLFFRSTLVVIQFAITIALMSATFVVYAQMNYSRTKALQFEQKSVLALSVMKDKGAGHKMTDLAALLSALDGVERVALSDILPPAEIGAAIVQRRGFEKDGLKVIGIGSVSPDFFETYGIDLIEGRNLSSAPRFVRRDTYTRPTPERPETFNRAVINESTLDYLGFSSARAAIGQYIDFGVETSAYVSHMEVIGVVPDANFDSSRRPIGPMMFYMAPQRFHAFSLKLTGDDTARTLGLIKDSWDLFYPDTEINMRFVDESYDKLYAQEITRGRLFAGFSLLAMFIACLGLYGLASVAAERRTQEIGLRKVMGASVWDIVGLLVWQFSRPVLLANLIAWPVAFLAMQLWLSDFAFRIELTPAPFLTSTAITLFVAFTTVTWHARKVAMARPAETLRYE